MHTVHYPDAKQENGFIAAAMGIMFSVEDATVAVSAAEEAIITAFFDNL